MRPHFAQDDKLILAAQIAYEFDERADGSSGRAFGHPGLAVFNPSHTGDVEVNPWRVADEFLEEHCGRYCSAPAASTVDDVGDVGLDHLAIFFVDGKAPHLLARGGERFVEAIVEAIVVGEDTDVD